MATVGERVRRYRRLRKLTQDELAERSAVDRRQIGRLEAGEVLEPAAETVKRLALALGVPIRELAEPLGWYEDEPRVGDPLAQAEAAILQLEGFSDEEKQAIVTIVRTHARREKVTP